MMTYVAFSAHSTTNGHQSSPTWIRQCQRANFTFRWESSISSNDNGI